MQTAHKLPASRRDVPFSPRADRNALTGPVFDLLPKFAGPKVIYVAANRMGARAAREGITFKPTPHALDV